MIPSTFQERHTETNIGSTSTNNTSKLDHIQEENKDSYTLVQAHYCFCPDSSIYNEESEVIGYKTLHKENCHYGTIHRRLIDVKNTVM